VEACALPPGTRKGEVDFEHTFCALIVMCELQTRSQTRRQRQGCGGEREFVGNQLPQKRIYAVS
jgi:hypothetical protein